MRLSFQISKDLLPLLNSMIKLAVRCKRYIALVTQETI